MDASDVTLGAFVLLSVLLAAFVIAWRRASHQRARLRKELAEKKALLADTSDKLFLEQQNAIGLSNALNAAESEIAVKANELGAARKKIASLNDENDSIYANYLDALKGLKLSGVELQFWQYFARKVLLESRLRLEQVDAFLKDNLGSASSPRLTTAVESQEAALELLELADRSDIAQRIRNTRAEGKYPLVHLMPRLRHLLGEWQQTLGSRLSVKVPDLKQAVLFAGSWVHLELVLITMLANAAKHSIEASDIEFEFSCNDHLATFQVTNLSPTPVSESIVRAKNEMMLGDPQQTRFDLYLLDQLAAGYRAIVKLENLGLSSRGEGHIVRASFAFALR